MRIAAASTTATVAAAAAATAATAAGATAEKAVIHHEHNGNKQHDDNPNEHQFLLQVPPAHVVEELTRAAGEALHFGDFVVRVEELVALAFQVTREGISNLGRGE